MAGFNGRCTKGIGSVPSAARRSPNSRSTPTHRGLISFNAVTVIASSVRNGVIATKKENPPAYSRRIFLLSCVRNDHAVFQ